jgi:hypothetical protein
LDNPVAPAYSPERFVAAPAANGRDSADPRPFDTQSPQDDVLQDQARSFSGLMSGNSSGRSASLDQDGSSAQVPASELPLDAVKALLAGRDPLSAQELASWSALWSAYAPDDDADADSTLATSGTGSGQKYLQDSRNHAGTDISSLSMHQSSASNSISDPQAVAASADPDLTFAELIARHVRRALATTRSTARSGGGEVRIELTDIVLPETTLSLRHSAQGWHLLGVTGNRQSLERLDRFAPALVRRFAAASLGQLEVVTRLASRPEASAADDG